MTRNYIGIANTFHDGAIAIVNSRGEVVFAESSERFLQYKRALNVMPDLLGHTLESLRQYCDPGAELIPAFSWSAQRSRLVENQAKGLSPIVQSEAHRLKGSVDDSDRYAMRWLSTQLYMSSSQWKALIEPDAGLRFLLDRRSESGFQVGAPRFYDHHLTHAATGCFTSPFDKAICVVIDGIAEGCSCDWYIYKSGKLEKGASTLPESTASLGVFYSNICSACGFDPLGGEEWKVMGLAPYGRLDDELYELFRSMIWVNGDSIESPSAEDLRKAQRKLHSLRRKEGEPSLASANMAYTGQRVFTEIVIDLLRNLSNKADKCENLVFGGGCALNSVTNGQISTSTSFKNLHVFAAPADDGNAIGAALLAYAEDNPHFMPPRTVMTPYLGSRMSSDKLDKVVEFSRIPKLKKCIGRAPEMAAEMLSRGLLIGWIQGRAEFGPRALGNRSILADPRSSSVKDALNARVKFREEFRPFAPSILHEFGVEYFEDYQESPYMERALKFKEEVMAKVPGVVHVDGSGRLQTVKQEWNEPFFRLIRRFLELTGIPLVLNTSFNVMGKPIAHSIEDALAVFYTSGLDAIFIEDVLIEK